MTQRRKRQMRDSAQIAESVVGQVKDQTAGEDAEDINETIDPAERKTQHKVEQEQQEQEA